MKKAKTAYLHSLLALLVCISMFVGSTFAWFTDSVSSVNNIITSGNLDLEMYWTNDLNSGTWYNVEDPAYNTIFNYDNWEPGYTDVRYIKIVNKGSLAFKYQLAVTPVGAVGKLAEVIDVYYANDGVTVANRDELSNLTGIGLLSNVMNGGATAEGVLLPDGQTNPSYATGETVVTLAMSMLTTAGNEYQLQSVGDGFTITVMATQMEHEVDSFGPDYDADAEFPAMIESDSASADVEVAGGQTVNEVTIAGSSVSATVPAGVSVADGVEKLTLTVTPLENTTSDITPVNGEVLMPIDVHIDGIAEDNTTPIIIKLGAILPKYLNMGNYQLYHVEDGVTETMNLVDSEADLVDHNDYTYDPATGEVTVAMASFSEIAVVAVGETYNVWKGGVDYSWYNAGEPYVIYNADQLNGLAYIVSGYDDNGNKITQDGFKGKTITLARNIDINGGVNIGETIKRGNTIEPVVFYPIGYRARGEGANQAGEDVWYKYGGAFEGIFDGNGHTIKGIQQRTWDMNGNYDYGYYKAAMGLFGYVYGGTVKNLTIDSFFSEGEFTPTGCVTAFAGGDATFENIRLVDCNPCVYNTGNGGIVGWDESDDDEEGNFTFKNITIDATNKITALWGSWDVACGGLMGRIGPSSKANISNCKLSATIDVYNDVCANYQYYWYRYAGMVIGTVDKTLPGGNAIDVSNITLSDCTVDFGNRHEYVYCEFVKNSLASYTHDHQFSRVPHSEVKYDDVNGNGVLDTGDTVTGCTHDHKSAGCETKVDVNGDGIVNENDWLEDRFAYWIPFRQLFGGYGWGVRGVAEHANINVNVINPAEKKFELDLFKLGQWTSVEAGVTSIPVDFTGEPIEIGKYFKAIGNADINESGVHVTVTALDDNSQVVSEFALNEQDWTKSLLTIKADENAQTAYVAISIQDYDNCEPTIFRARLQNSLDNETDVPEDW